MKICFENIYNFPSEIIMSLRVHPLDRQVACDEVFRKKEKLVTKQIFTST